MTTNMGILGSDWQKAIYEKIAQSISQTMNLPVSIWAPDETGTKLTIKASVGLAKSYVKRAVLFLKEPSVTGKAFQTGELVFVRDVLKESDWKYVKPAREMGWKSVLCVPIIIRHTVIAVVSVYTFVEKDFSDIEKRLITDYVSQVEVNFEREQNERVLTRLMAVSNQLQRRITESPKKIYQEIVKSACELTGAHCAVLYPYDYRREDFYETGDIADHGLLQPLAVKEKPRSKTGMAAYVRQQGEVVYNDLEKDNPDMLTNSKFIVREMVRAFLGISLQVGDEVLGVLYVNFRTPHRFTVEEKDLIHLFAYQAAIAIYRSRLYDQAESRAEALRKLHQFSPALIMASSSLEELGTALDRIREQATGALSADRVELFQYDRSQGALFLAQMSGVHMELETGTIHVNQYAFLASLIKQQKPAYLTNPEIIKTWIAAFDRCLPENSRQQLAYREDIKALAVVPIIVGNEVFGVMLISYLSAQTFPKDQKELIELFAGQAAVAIHNGRLSEERKILQETSRDLTQITDIDVLLQKLLTQALKLFGCEIGSICLYNITTGYLEYRYSRGKGKYAGIAFGQGLIGTAAETKQIIYCPDVRKDTRYREHAKETRSELDIPLLIGEELIGVLNAESTRLDGFRPTTREMAQVLANHAAAALYNAGLYEKTLQRLDQRLNDIKAFRQVYEKLGSASLDEILGLVVEQAVSITSSDYGSLWEINGSENQLRFRVEVNRLGQQVNGINVLPMSDDSPVGASVLKGATCLVDNNRTRYPLHTAGFFESGVIVPLKYGGHVVGALELESLEKDKYDSDQIRLLETLAGQAAEAIEDARQYNRLHVLVDIVQAITPTMQETEILNTLLAKALDAIGAGTGTIHLINRSTGDLEIRAYKGPLIEPNHPFVRLKPGEGVTGWVAVKNQPVLINNVHQQKNEPFFVEYLAGTQSELAVPIRYKDRTLGVLNAESNQLNAFDENDLQLFETIANQVAVIIRTAAQYRATREINQVASELAHTIHMPEQMVLELIHKHTSELMDTQNLYIALYDETFDSETGQMVGTVRFGLAFEDGNRVDIENDPRWAWRKKGQGRTEEIIDTGKPILHKTQQEAKDWYAQLGRKEYLGYIAGSWLGVPMLVGGQVLGVIAVYHNGREYVYDEEDQEVLTAMANLAAVALENYRRYYKRELGYRSLIELGEALNANIRLEEDEILELMQTKAGEQGLMDTSNMFIALYDEEKDEVRFVLSYENNKKLDLITDTRWHPRIHGSGRTEEIIRLQKPILIRTHDEAGSWYQQSGRKEYLGNVLASWLGVPMLLREKVVGVVVVFHPTKDFLYNQDDQEILQALANQTAIALENARLYKQTQADAQENARLYQQTRGELVAAKQLAALGTAVAALNHRINNTSSIILPNVARLRRRLDPDDPTLKEILDIIERNARLTSDIITRLQSPLQEVALGGTNINAILQEKIYEVTKNAIEPYPERSGTQIIFSPDDRIPLFKAPFAQLSEVFKNLIENAVRVTRSPGCIEVISLLEPKEEKCGTIYVRVKDTGPGILPKIKERLFVKPVPSSDPSQGAGLGLWINNLIIKSLNGSIQVESTGDSGTVILVKIPIPEEPQEGRE